MLVSRGYNKSSTPSEEDVDTLLEKLIKVNYMRMLNQIDNQIQTGTGIEDNPNPLEARIKKCEFRLMKLETANANTELEKVYEQYQKMGEHIVAIDKRLTRLEERPVDVIEVLGELYNWVYQIEWQDKEEGTLLPVEALDTLKAMKDKIAGIQKRYGIP
jgi:hypothetical protein